MVVMRKREKNEKKNTLFFCKCVYCLNQKAVTRTRISQEPISHENSSFSTILNLGIYDKEKNTNEEKQTNENMEVSTSC